VTQVPLHALLDGGKIQRPNARRSGAIRRSRDVKVLAVTEIEGAYTESAVARWIG